MGAEQEMQGEIQYEEEAYTGEDEAVVPEEQKAGQQEGYMVMEEAYEQNQELEEKPSSRKTMSNVQSRRSFGDGVSVGLGIGCIATFIVMWISLFFSPQLPSSATYEAMLSVFIYPLIYLLSVGLVALTAGFVREYYARK